MKEPNIITPVERAALRHKAGLGDLVHGVANPIAKAIDFVAGTDLQNCPSCNGRREALNRNVPFKRKKNRPCPV